MNPYNFKTKLHNPYFCSVVRNSHTISIEKGQHATMQLLVKLLSRWMGDVGIKLEDVKAVILDSATYYRKGYRGGFFVLLYGAWLIL